MKSVQKPIQTINRQFSVSKDTATFSMLSPDKMICQKTQSQMKIHGSYQASPPQQLENSYQYQRQEVFKPHNQQEGFKQNILQNEFNTYKYEYNKTFAGNFQSDTNIITERKSNTTKKDGSTIVDSKENNFQTKSPILDTQGNSRLSSQNFSQKSKLQNDINKISGSLRELLSSVQKNMGTNKLTDSINDKMIEILSNFRKLEDSCVVDNDQKMAEDYSKLKAILEQLQTKMSALVQENQKLNKSLIEQEQRVTEEQKKRQIAESQANQANKEFNRVFECLQINQKENEELKLSNNNDELRIKYSQLQKEFEKLQFKLTEKSIIKEIPKSPALVKQSEQLELKLLQLQIENDNLKAEMAHMQVDSKAIDNKNEMISKLEEKIKSILKEKSISEEQSLQICQNLEILNDQLKKAINNKENEVLNLQKQRNEMERDLKCQLNMIQKTAEDKLVSSKQDYQKLLDEYKQMDLRKNKAQEDLRNSEKKAEQQLQELNYVKSELKKTMDRNSMLSNQLEQLNQQLQQQSQQFIQQLEQQKQLEQSLRQECDRLENTLQSTKQELKYQVTELNEMIQLQARKTQEKERQLNEILEEMEAMKDQYEVQKKVFQENVSDLERRLKNQKLQQEEILQVKEQEILDLKQAMEQQIKMLDKRNALCNFDYDQREQQLQSEIQQKTDQLEAVKSELEKVRSNNFNIQEELLRAGMLLNQHQVTIASYRNELNQSKQEQQHLSEMLKKRKEETEQLHGNLEEMRKELQNKKQPEDSRRSILRQQDLQIAFENLQRENLSLQQRTNSIQNELSRKIRELSEKNEEYMIMKRKYEETVSSLERLERRWGEKIDQHRKN